MRLPAGTTLRLRGRATRELGSAALQGSRGTVRLDPVDSLTADDTYRFVAAGERPVRVLLVQAGGATRLDFELPPASAVTISGRCR